MMIDSYELTDFFFTLLLFFIIYYEKLIHHTHTYTPTHPPTIINQRNKQTIY